MLNQKAMTALLSLALAGSMAVPAFAADANSAQPLTREATPVLAEYGRTDSVYLPIAANGFLTRAELVAALHEQFRIVHVERAALSLDVRSHGVAHIRALVVR